MTTNQNTKKIYFTSHTKSFDRDKEDNFLASSEQECLAQKIIINNSISYYIRLDNVGDPVNFNSIEDYSKNLKFKKTDKITFAYYIKYLNSGRKDYYSQVQKNLI